jgi:hypothetical protein
MSGTVNGEVGAVRLSQVGEGRHTLDNQRPTRGGT